MFYVLLLRASHIVYYTLEAIVFVFYFAYGSNGVKLSMYFDKGKDNG